MIYLDKISAVIVNSLVLHNFMSYADAKVDLTSVAVACLTGLNGSGKSALLDAITWALWESARASSDELVRLGQTEMWVDLCFSLENQVYRVRRSRQKSFGRNGNQTSSKGQLYLQVWDGDEATWLSSASDEQSAAESHWRSLSAPSMRETQRRLRELLRMDYETFISSVYLKQGRADEFTTRSPNDRKQVLADILGLDYFDRLQELARNEARERKGMIQVLESTLGDGNELERGYQDSCADMEVIGLQITSEEQSLLDAKDRLTEIEAQIAKLNYLQIRAETAKARQSELRADLFSLEVQLTDLDAHRKKLTALIQQAAFVNQQNSYFEEYKARSEKLDFSLQAFTELSSKRAEARSRLAMIQGRLEVEYLHLKQSIELKLTRKSALEKSTRDKQKLEDSFTEYRKLMEFELDLSRRRESFSSLTLRADELQSMISEARVRLDADVRQKESLLDELDQIISLKEQIQSEQQVLEAEADELDRVETQFELVEEKGLKIKSSMEFTQQEIVQLRKHLKENSEKVVELCSTPDLSSCPLCRAPIVDGRAVLDRYNLDSATVQHEIGSLESKFNELELERDALRQQYVDLRRKLEARKRLDRKIGEFNERKLAVERATGTREELEKSISTSKQKLADQTFAPIEKESLIRVKAEISKLDFDPIIFSNVQAQMRAQRHIEVRYQQIQRDLKELLELDAELPQLIERRDQMQKDLEEEEFGPEHREEVSKLEDAIFELAYDKTAHQELKRKLVELLPFAEKARDIRKAIVDLPELERNYENLSVMVTSRSDELVRLDDEESERANRLDELPLLKEQFDDAEKNLFVLQESLEDLRRRKTVLETRVEQLAHDRSALDSKRKSLAEAIKEMSEYNVLAEAFGKKGLQAIIIENAIPEIEEETNRILNRLTDNQMHVAIVTQQRTRQGNPVETLDILIADDLGTRSYELYSGGEAFKVNFAIRVALSRLLARRANAKLETLIIDEGFGSQDEHSRTKLIQAIGSIRRDFARIIVVTHIAEVKEMFPVQISVSKEEGVSKVAILV